LITCIVNDFGSDSLFSRQVEGLGRAEDTLVVFSSSGNSENLVRALDRAKELRLSTIALLGRGGGKSAGRADVEILVPSDSTARVQEVHTLTLHLWLSMVESLDWEQHPVNR
jgi:D-sedoheptulose 7-phosphate isomerase